MRDLLAVCLRGPTGIVAVVFLASLSKGPAIHSHTIVAAIFLASLTKGPLYIATPSINKIKFSISVARDQVTQGLRRY